MSYNIYDIYVVMESAMDYIPYKFPKKQIGDKVFEVLQMEHHILQQRRNELKLTQ